MPIEFSRLFYLLPSLLVVFVFGLLIIASGQLFLAIREIALNTRKDDSEEVSKYVTLFAVAKINNIIGWLILIFGTVATIMLAFTDAF
jgi:hypothetical protein